MVMVSVRKTYAEVVRGGGVVSGSASPHNITGNERDGVASSSASRGPAARGSAYVPADEGSGQSTNQSTFADRSFYECCQTEGVPILCRPLCNLNAMISDQTKPYMYTLCYNYMSHIFRCISDGRNHLPCCQRQNVPQLCQPSCTGRYSLEKALDHAICHEHSKTILFCIADGLQVMFEFCIMHELI